MSVLSSLAGKPTRSGLPNGRGQHHESLGSTFGSAVAQDPSSQLVSTSGRPAEDDRLPAGHDQRGGGLGRLDHTRAVGRKPADGRRQSDPHLVPRQDCGPDLQRGTDVLELDATDDVAGAGEVVAIVRDLGIRNLACDDHRRLAAVLDERENASRPLRPPLGAVYGDAARRARAAIGDHHPPAAVDRAAILGGRLPELEEDLHLLIALGGDRNPSAEQDDEQRERSDCDRHVPSLARLVPIWRTCGYGRKSSMAWRRVSNPAARRAEASSSALQYLTGVRGDMSRSSAQVNQRFGAGRVSTSLTSRTPPGDRQAWRRDRSGGTVSGGMWCTMSSMYAAATSPSPSNARASASS